MRIAYLILAHKYPELLNRLINRLDSINNSFYIHIDKNSSMKPFLILLNRYKKSNVYFIRRERSVWGSIGLVKAVLNGFTEILDSKQKYDYIFLLSGQDYPIKSNDYIFNFLQKNNGKNFISYFLCNSNVIEDWQKKILSHRIGKYHLQLFGKWFEYPKQPNSLLEYMVNFYFRLKFPINRQHPEYLEPYADSQWFCITYDTVKYILDFIRNNPDYYEYHKYTFIPDEMFFQTIILNTKNELLSNSIVNDNLKYIDWSKPHLYHPMIFDVSYFDVLKNSQKLFARKFDLTVCPKILDLLDYN